MYGISEQLGQHQPLGFILMDVAGTRLSEEEQQRLMHPAIAGVILFRRNYADPEQLQALTQSIHALRHPRLLVAVDHEGGRVQRFQTGGFTRLPPMRQLGELFDRHAQQALAAAEDLGWLLASELLSCGVDFSFAPVLDLDYGNSSVIGDRALHHNPHVVGLLASALMTGMRSAGMACVGKHFPGHGHVLADTHTDMAVDERSIELLWGSDIQPFKTLIQQHVAAIMPAHVIYPAVDALPAGMSSIWLQQMLRDRLGFQGAIISDDLSMHAVASRADPLSLTRSFQQAGCDLVLHCNAPERVSQVLAGLQDHESDPIQESRLIRLHGRPQMNRSGLAHLHESADWLRRMKHLVQAGLVHWSRDS